MSYLVDSNVLLRLSQPNNQHHKSARQAIINIRLSREQISIVPQNLIEFWAVATRPVQHNGLGLDIAKTQFEIRKFKRLFKFESDGPEVYSRWEYLVGKYRVLGKNVHDAKLVAAMLEHGISHLLTFNFKDFKRYSEITVVSPEDIAH